MSHWSKIEQDPAVIRLREAAARGTLSHAMLFTGSGDRLAVARYAAAALECESETGRPCGACRACRKVQENIHPDVITVQDPEHKNLSADVVRAVRSDAYIRPNEGRRKVYLFPDCSILPEQGQNILLKVVEEGPPYAVFLFCAENGSAVLQTLRSRCVELKCASGEAAEEESSEWGETLCRVIGGRKRGAVAELAVRLEKKRLDRESVAAMLERGRSLFAAALLSLYGQQPKENDREIVLFLAKNLTKNQIMSTIGMLEKYHGECAYNVGVGHVLGALAAELEGIL